MDFWCREQLEIVVQAPGQDDRVARLDQPFARIGSGPGADLCLAELRPEPLAVYLHAAAEGVFCLSLEPPQPERPLAGGWLSPEGIVGLAPYRLQVRLDLGRLLPHSSAPDLLERRREPPFPLIDVTSRGRALVKRRLRARLNLVGRFPGCTVQLEGKLVSGFHCCLYWDQGRLWCIDLNSDHQTRINGEPVVCSEVAVGDRIEVGEFVLVFRRLSYSGVLEEGVTQPRAHADVPAKVAVAAEHPVMTSPPADVLQVFETQVARLAEQREALAQARRDWESERSELRRQVEMQTVRLAVVERELANLRTCSNSMIVSNKASEATGDERADCSPQTEMASVMDSHKPDPAESPSERRQDNDVPTSALIVRNPESAAVAARNGVVEPRPTNGPPPPRGRGRIARDDLTTFVGDRLVQIDTVRRRRRLLIWGCVLLGLAGVAVAAAGAWYWFGSPWHP